MADNNMIVSGLNEKIVGLHTFINKPEVKAKMFRSYGAGLMYTYLLKYFTPDRELTVGAATMTSQEKNYFWATIHAATVVSYPGAPGDPFIFTLDPVLDIDSQGNFSVRERQILNLGTVNSPKRAWIPQGGIVSTGGLNPTVTITCYPTDNATFTSTTIAAGDQITLGSIATGHGSIGVKGTVTGYNEFTHYAQSFAENFSAEDFQMAQQHWAQKEGIGWWLEESAETEFKLDFQLEDAAMWGLPNLNTTNIVDASDNSGANYAVGMNKGLWSWANDYGYILNYDLSTGLTVVDFDNVSEYYTSKGMNAPTALALMGITLYINMETTLKDYITGTTGALNELFTPKSGDVSKDLTMSFKNLVKGGISFHMVNCDGFNNPYFMGAAKAGGKTSGLIVPLGMAHDEKAGAVPNVSVRYVGINGYVRNKVITYRPGRGGFAGQKLGVNYTNHNADWTGMDWLTEAMYPVYQPWELTAIKGLNA